MELVLPVFALQRVGETGVWRVLAPSDDPLRPSVDVVEVVDVAVERLELNPPNEFQLR